MESLLGSSKVKKTISTAWYLKNSNRKYQNKFVTVKLLLKEGFTYTARNTMSPELTGIPFSRGGRHGDNSVREYEELSDFLL